MEGLYDVQVDLTASTQERNDLLLQLIGTASAVRVTNDNEFNIQSSRGHLIITAELTINVTGQVSRAQFVDLAGGHECVWPFGGLLDLTFRWCGLSGSEKEDATSLTAIMAKQLGKRGRHSAGTLNITVNVPGRAPRVDDL